MERNITSEYVASRPEALRPASEAANESLSSGVSWGAVIGGAFAASAMYLILLALGAGFGLSAISPWSSLGASSTAVKTIAIIWLLVIEVIASALGGYLTGRLRTKWTRVHTDEVFFRDTANGFLSWAVALVVSATLLGSAASTMVGSFAGSALPPDNVATAGTNSNAYFVDTLFRTDRGDLAARNLPGEAETARIFGRAVGTGRLAAEDRDYLVRQVAATTGVTQAEAARRVDDTLAAARLSEDTARRATAHFLLWLFVSLLLGAFCASLSATIGGRTRDRVRTV